MNGVHPFQAKGPLVRDAPATSDKILLGHFAFESRLFGIEPPDYAPPYARVPAPVKNLFVKPSSSATDPQKFVLMQGDGCRCSVLSSRQRQAQEEDCSTSCAEAKRPEYRSRVLIDSEGSEVVPKRLLYWVGDGMVYETTDKGVLLYLLNAPLPRSSHPSLTGTQGIPPSVIIATRPVTRGESLHAGWIICWIDRGRYLPWHMVSDRESRKDLKGAAFSFRHRVACCRNFISALLSINRLNLQMPVVSARSVYVGPDASVRVLSLPKTTNEQGERPEEIVCSPAILIFQMLMEGYHPYHGTGSRVKGYGSPERRMKAGMFPWIGSDPALTPPRGAPLFDILPARIRELFEEEFCEKNQDLSLFNPEALVRWFEIFDQILGSLVCCTRDPDHWFIPGLSGCPWCNRSGRSGDATIRAEPLLLPAPKMQILLLRTTRIAGLLAIPGRCVRRDRVIRMSEPRWGVIPLPPERIIRTLLPSSPDQLFLPLKREPENTPCSMETGMDCLYSAD